MSRNLASVGDPGDQSQSELAYHRLRTGILAGELAAGDRLRVSDLQERFSFGLTPIREALMRLTSEGLVETELNRGSRVSPISLADFADLMKIRREVENLCLRQSIERGDSQWEANIVAAMHLLARSPPPSSVDEHEKAITWEANHRKFHFALVAACGSPWLLRFWNMLVDHSERYRAVRLLKRNLPEASADRTKEAHEEIMHAVLERDIALASRLMDAHLALSEKAIANILEKKLD